MELMFNEQSVTPSAQTVPQACSAVIQFIKTYKEAESHGFKRIRYEKTFDRIELSSDFTLNDFCCHPSFRTYGGLLLGLARHPFIDSDSREEQRFVDNEFYIKRGRDLIAVEGLGVAFLYQSVGLSFNFDGYWNRIKHRLSVEGAEAGEYDVISISHPDHCTDADFVRQADLWKPLRLAESPDAPSDKAIHLRDDHGKDVLEAFAKRLCQSPYVKYIVNSLPYHPMEPRFIHDIKVNGLIEIVLTKTDKGLGLVVQSTGRNLRETKAIAEFLEKEFA